MDFVPRIRVTKTDDIAVLVCGLIYSLGCPLSEQQLIEITGYEDAVNYFDLMAAIEKASERLCVVEEIDGEKYYSNTDAGIKIARELQRELPLSIREKLFAEAVRVYTRDAMKRSGGFLAVRFANNGDGSCTVGITIRDENTSRKKYFIEINAEDTEHAERIKQKVTSDPRGFAAKLEDFFK